MRPLVSVCVPTFRGARWIRETLDTALRQTVADLEVVVVDDGSDDATVSIARSTGDPRVRVLACARNVGLARNWNRALAATRGRFVKPLLQDDLLEPDCVERLLAPALDDDAVDLVFSPRRLVFDDPASPHAEEFGARSARLHERFARLEPVNPRGSLSAQWIEARLLGNFVGEPTCVLVRRAAFERHGAFHVRMRQLVDMECWGRLAFHGAVAFVDAPLSTFRVHAASASRRQTSAGLDWLDRLWMIEGLLRDPAIASAHPELRRYRAQERRCVVRRLVRPPAGRGPRVVRRALPGLREYLVDRLRRVAGTAPPLDPRLGPAPS